MLVLRNLSTQGNKSFYRDLNAQAMILQRTLKKAISFSGIGLHTGNKITVTMRPAVSSLGQGKMILLNLSQNLFIFN